MKLDTFARKKGDSIEFIYKTQIKDFLEKLEEGEEINIKVSTVRDSKSIKQLRMLYRIYGLIADYMGEEVPKVHVYLKNMFLLPDVIEIRGETYLECQTLSTISKKDMVLYITNVIDWATRELNLKVVDSEDLDLLT